MTLDELNECDPAAFVAALGPVFEHSPWVAQTALTARPFTSVSTLLEMMVDVIERADPARQLALLRAHPDLAGRASLRSELTALSRAEQDRAGLAHCTPQELAMLQSLNAAYRKRFGFPFIVAVRGMDRAGVIEAMKARIANAPPFERAEALRQVGRIAALRLADMLGGSAAPVRR